MVRKKKAKEVEEKIEIKNYICPKCTSNNVSKVHKLKNLFGLYPRFKCNKCNYEEVIFPLLISKKGKKTRKRRKR